ncbi:MAG: hypothetical protein HYV09_20605 [Deltaproteobacteria bacterium]|nr:hypothetical protein [Deltaproteobacteria bacterium]
MHTDLASTPVLTTLDDADRRALEHLLRAARGHVHLPPLGAFRRMESDEIWAKLVRQACVLGSSREMERIEHDPVKAKKFFAAIRPAALRDAGLIRKQMSRVLSDYQATRFPLRTARALTEMLDNERIVVGTRVVLLEGLDMERSGDELRAELRRRCPLLSLKCASDFMIEVGLSHDVIALDTKVLAALRAWFGCEVSMTVVQSREAVYTSIEAALRSECARLGVRLGELGRTITQLSGKTALEFLMER